MEAQLAHREPGGERGVSRGPKEEPETAPTAVAATRGAAWAPAMHSPGGPSRPGRATRREDARQHWRLAAVLFAGGGVGAIPSDALHQPAQPASIYLLPLLAILSGVACWLLAERNLPRVWLHATGVAATAEVAITVGLADRVFAIYFVFVAIYAAYVFHRRRAIAIQVGFASLAVLAPVLYDPDTARETLVAAFALIPTLFLAAASVTFLRERLEASERSYRALAERDPLTDVGNYRMLTEHLPRELARHGQHERSLSLIVIDLDNFKHVNDAYGHQRGDETLRQVARCLCATVRAADVVVRQGGDEFCVVAPGTGKTMAEDLARRLEAAIAEINIGGTPLGATTGWAVFPGEAETMERLMAEADGRLRLSKAENPGSGRQGR